MVVSFRVAAGSRGSEARLRMVGFVRKNAVRDDSIPPQSPCYIDRRLLSIAPPRSVLSFSLPMIYIFPGMRTYPLDSNPR